MKLEFLDDITDNGKYPYADPDKLIRIFSFDQIEAEELINVIEYWILNKGESINISNLSFVPVSYTHLDVYKRQTLHSRINALKFYFEQVLKREKFFWNIPRPQKPLQLPKLLNETELTRLFNSLRNKKHKAMLFTAYSSGLRVSEVARLMLADIDAERMQIHVRHAKGKKDRYVNLSPVLLDILRQYIKPVSYTHLDVYKRQT